MSQTANDANSKPAEGWWRARNQLFQMIKEGRSFSGRERNCCFLNLGDGGDQRFATVSMITGVDHADDGRSLALVDWNQDGKLDYWTANRNAPRLRLMINQGTHAGHWIQLQLEGDGVTSNRDAIGARVVLKSQGAGRANTMTVRAGQGFLSQSSKQVHFGLGDQDSPLTIEVAWPGGKTETYVDLTPNHRYRLRQGEAKATPLATRDVPLPSDDASQIMPRTPLPSRVSLSHRPVMPRFNYRKQGDAVTPFVTEGHPTLLTLWASWCQPCLKELAEWHQALNDPSSGRSVRPRVVALSVDRIGPTPTPLGDVARVGEAFASTIEWGTLEPDQLELLQGFHDLFFFKVKPLPLPTTFLISSEGRLMAIFKGPVSLEQVAVELKRPHSSYVERAEAGSLLGGRSVGQPLVEEKSDTGDLQTAYRVASWFEQSHDLSSAVAQFSLVAKLAPKWDVPWQHLAKLNVAQGDLGAAVRAARKTLELNPENPRAFNTLALIASRQREPERAISFLRRAIKFDPNYVEAHNNLAVELATKGQIDNAIRHWEAAIETDPLFAEALTNLGSAHLSKGESARAIRYYQQAIRADEQYADAYLNLGTTFAQLGQLEKSIPYFEHVLKLEPQHRGARANLNRAKQLLSRRSID